MTPHVELDRSVLKAGQSFTLLNCLQIYLLESLSIQIQAAAHGWPWPCCRHEVIQCLNSQWGPKSEAWRWLQSTGCFPAEDKEGGPWYLPHVFHTWYAFYTSLSMYTQKNHPPLLFFFFNRLLFTREINIWDQMATWNMTFREKLSRVFQKSSQGCVYTFPRRDTR